MARTEQRSGGSHAGAPSAPTVAEPASVTGSWPEAGTVTACLARFGVYNYSRKSTRVVARLPDRHERQYLGLPRSRPVLVTESVDVDEEGKAVQFGITRFVADRVQLLMEV